MRYFCLFPMICDGRNKNIKAGKDMFFIEDNSAEVDMCIIAHCNHTGFPAFFGRGSNCVLQT